MKMNRRKRLFLLFFSLGLVLTVLLLVLMDRSKTPVSSGEEDFVRGADLTISNFQHTATEKGKILWTLEADTAAYRKQDKLVGLFSVKIDYFQEDGSKITATSKKGLANTGTHDLKLMESVEVISPDYRVNSEELSYVAEIKTFISPGKTFISGEGFFVEADSARYETASGLLFLSGKVKGELHESP
ncbi:LPS export ABC transporter periplasmic protein LptC [Desulfococcaceae bacterium OttesenSCG-928-F15]|nr:LPS export ABC transporter periplasmic protein LptC [Desulfococcaceae bacterium OttesenSCG-928-F15]